MILDIFKNKNIQVIISILWGFGLAMLFRRSCKGRNCIIIKGPKSEEMDNKVFRHDNKCYKYTAETTTCKVNNQNTQTIDIRS
jgi:hypothetical protein